MNNNEFKILLADTDPGVLTRIRRILSEEEFGVWTSNDPGEIMRIYQGGDFDLLILDIKIYAQLKLQQFQIQPDNAFAPPVIIMTTDEDFPLAIEVIQEGAADFLDKPIRVKRLLITIRNALQHSHKFKEMSRHQQELASLKELYERIINGIDYGIVVLDQNLRIESINDYLQRRGRSRATALGRYCYRFFYNHRAICDDCHVKEVFESAAPVKYNLVHKAIGGASSYLEVEAFPLFDVSGRVNRVVQLIKDITERIQLERELREKKEYLENLLAHAPVGIFTTDRDGFIQAINPAFAEILGAKSLTDARGLNVLESEIFKQNDLDKKFRQVLTEGKAFEVEAVHCHSTWDRTTICSLRCVPLRGEGDEVAGLIATVADVTEKSKLEESYRKRITELSNFKEIGELLQGTVDLNDIYIITLIGVTAGMGLGFNRAFILRYDRSKNMLIGESAIGPSDAAEAGRIWSELYEKRLSIKEIFDSYKETLGDRDVKVREIVQRLKVSLTWEEGILQEVLFHNTPYKVTDANSGRYSDQKMIAAELGCQSFAVVPLISRGKAEGIIIADNLITGKEISDEDINRLSIIANQAGAAIENSQLLQNLEEKVEALRVAYLDLKENRDLLLRAERLSVVGEVAASVAHEIRNPLTSIGGFARAVLRDIGEKQKLQTNRRFLKIILEEVKRLETIVTEILGFVRPVTPKFAPNNLNEVIEQTLSMMSGEIDEDRIIITKDYQIDLPPVWIDTDQIRQVLLNLFRNAIHAMKERGMLSIITVSENETVKLHVSDTGEGIPDENMDKLFNAFFTTKSTGSGLGLTIAMQIIKNHGGSIAVESKPGEGSTFTISLPLRSGEEKHEKETTRRRRRKESTPSV